MSARVIRKSPPSDLRVGTGFHATNAKRLRADHAPTKEHRSRRKRRPRGRFQPRRLSTGWISRRGIETRKRFENFVDGNQARGAGHGAQGRTRRDRCRVGGPGCQDCPLFCARQFRGGENIPGMIENRTGMQNGVQVVHIVIKAGVSAGHVVLPCSFQRWDGFRIARKTT